LGVDFPKVPAVAIKTTPQGKTVSVQRTTLYKATAIGVTALALSSCGKEPPIVEIGNPEILNFYDIRDCVVDEPWLKCKVTNKLNVPTHLRELIGDTYDADNVRIDRYALGHQSVGPGETVMAPLAYWNKYSGKPARVVIKVNY
jgi:hypothetical protein